jgi:hypothetical protein
VAGPKKLREPPNEVGGAAAAGEWRDARSFDRPGFDVDVYLVLDDFGPLGRAYREAEEDGCDRGTIIRNLKSGEYNNPVRVVAFNTAEGWARDVTAEIACEIHGDEYVDRMSGADAAPFRKRPSRNKPYLVCRSCHATNCLHDVLPAALVNMEM